MDVLLKVWNTSAFQVLRTNPDEVKRHKIDCLVLVGQHACIACRADCVWLGSRR